MDVSPSDDVDVFQLQCKYLQVESSLFGHKIDVSESAMMETLPEAVTPEEELYSDGMIDRLMEQAQVCGIGSVIRTA